MNGLSDAALVARCRAGEAGAWEELVRRFSRYVYAICSQGFRLREHDAEDVFQEVFARAYQRLGTLRDDSAVRPWIGQLTRRLCLDRLATDGRSEPVEDLVAAGEDDPLERAEEAFVVHEALGELSEECQEILDRFFAQDQSYRTIGEQLDLPSGTIASRISRCLSKLRVELEGRNGAV